ncbi:DUF397 domain-containing protein [Kitasatospora acidiphila]|uniref:DUF397 domain-containing protein n=1 Tax=Kitasatospora acidiphila TaxID=2567942 RepID=UPI003C783690
MSYHPNADETGFTFVKSTYSSHDGNCVELAVGLPGEIAVRDSKNPTGPAHRYSADAAWQFMSAIGSGGLVPVN